MPCIERYIENIAGCSSPFQQFFSSKALCSRKDKFKLWTKLIRTLYESDENSIYNLTSCLPACDYNEFRVTKPNAMEIKKQGRAVQGTTLMLRITAPRSQYTLKDQYYVYDGNSLIADIGGYLGLLLGHSIFSIVSILNDWFRYVATKKFKLLC